MIKNLWKSKSQDSKSQDDELKVIIGRKEFLLDSLIFTNQKYISSKIVKRMIEKLFEV